MTKIRPQLEQNLPHSFVLNMGSVQLTDEQFYRICVDNPELRFELTADRVSVSTIRLRLSLLFT